MGNVQSPLELYASKYFFQNKIYRLQAIQIRATSDIANLGAKVRLFLESKLKYVGNDKNSSGNVG